MSSLFLSHYLEVRVLRQVLVPQLTPLRDGGPVVEHDGEVRVQQEDHVGLEGSHVQEDRAGSTWESERERDREGASVEDGRVNENHHQTAAAHPRASSTAASAGS